MLLGSGVYDCKAGTDNDDDVVVFVFLQSYWPVIEKREETIECVADSGVVLKVLIVLIDISYSER